MANRFDLYKVTNGKTDLGAAETWNRRFKDIDARIGSVEEQKADLDAVIEEGREVFRTRSNEVLQPLIEEVFEIANVGTMLWATSSTEHDPTVTGGKTFIIDEGQRLRFAAPAYVAVYRMISPQAAMLGEVVSYTAETGELVVDIDRVSGAGYGGAWTITVASPSDTAEAIAEVLEARTVTVAAATSAGIARDEARVFRNDTSDLRDETQGLTNTLSDLADQVTEDAGQVATDRTATETAAGVAVGAKDEALAARTVAQTAASTATDKAAEANTQATRSETARAGSETALDLTETARDVTLGYRDEAEGFKEQAETAKTAAETAQSAVADAAATWSQIYLGAATADPVTDLNGDPLVDGAEYWNTTTGQKKVYSEGGWTISYVPVGSEVTTVFGRSGNVTAQLGDYSAAKITVSEISGVTGTTVQAMLASLKAIADGKSANGHTHAFADLTGKPTTLSGYGISDAYTKTQADALLANKLNISAFTGSAILTRLLDVDGEGSGLDADTIRGLSIGATGQGVYVAATPAAGRTALGLGSAALAATGDFAPASHTHPTSEITGLDTALNGKADISRTISTSGLATGGGSLSANRIINVTKSSQAQAQAGTDDTTAMTPVRTKDAINALVPVASTGTAGKTRFATASDAQTATLIAVDPALMKQRIDEAIASLIDGAPGAIDTLNELAAALGDDPNFATTVNNAIAQKLNGNLVSAFVLSNILGAADGGAIRTAIGLGSAALQSTAAFLAAGATAVNSDKLDGQDGSFYRNAGYLNAGTLPSARFTDGSHGNRAGGALHSPATQSINGFMSAGDKAKLDGIEAGATAIPDMSDAQLNAGADNTRRAVSAAQLKQAAKLWASCVPFATVRYEQPSGTSGGTNSAAAWPTYPLNSVHHDPESSITLASNQFTVDRDAYVNGFCTLYGSYGAMVRLFNVTDGVVVDYGECARNDSGTSSNNQIGAFVEAGKTYRIEYRVSAASSQGFGVNHGFGGTNVFASLDFWGA